VAGAHGVRGEVRLKLFAESVDSIARHKRVQIGSRDYRLVSIKPSGPAAVARFAELGDRNSAEALRGELVTVGRDALPALADGEYYHADLIGLPCVTAAGEPLGTVAAVENFGAGDILEIEQRGGRLAMVPFKEGVADLADGKIRVDPTFLA
jgi:16S rRNA processing protein RimM